LNTFSNANIIADEQPDGWHVQGHQQGDELEGFRDGPAALKSQERGAAVDQAEPISPEQKVLLGRVADRLGIGHGQLAGPHITLLKRPQQAPAPGVTPIKGCRPELPVVNSIYTPNPVAETDDRPNRQFRCHSSR
jgi:hypothetical protein